MQQPMPMRILAAACLAAIMLTPPALAQRAHGGPMPGGPGMGGGPIMGGPGLGGEPSMTSRRAHDYDEAFAARRAGQVMPLHQIEGKIVPKMPGCDYLGPEFDPSSGVYRLKFMRGGSVIYVDVDGRTGAIVGRSGN